MTVHVNTDFLVKIPGLYCPLNHSSPLQTTLGPGTTTPVLLPGKSHGRRSLVGCSPWGVAKSQARLRDFTFTFH